MNIKIKFNLKSSSPSIKTARQLSEKYNPKIIDNIIIVESNELSDDFKKLIEIVAHLNKTEIEVDGLQIDSQGYRLREILNCPKFNRCKGECSLNTYDWEEITYLLGLRKREADEEHTLVDFEENKFDQFGRNILSDFNSKEFTIDRDLLIVAYKERFKLTSILCSKFKTSKYLNSIEHFSPKQTFNIPKDNSFHSLSESELDTLKKEREVQYELDKEELIIKIADEVEKRMKKLLEDLKRP